MAGVCVCVCGGGGDCKRIAQKILVGKPKRISFIYSSIPQGVYPIKNPTNIFHLLLSPHASFICASLIIANLTTLLIF
jgi:hypothetical protein